MAKLANWQKDEIRLVMERLKVPAAVAAALHLAEGALRDVVILRDHPGFADVTQDECDTKVTDAWERLGKVLAKGVTEQAARRRSEWLASLPPVSGND